MFSRSELLDVRLAIKRVAVGNKVAAAVVIADGMSVGNREGSLLGLVVGLRDGSRVGVPVGS